MVSKNSRRETAKHFFNKSLSTQHRYSPSRSSRESLTMLQVLIPMATTGMPPPGHPPTGSGAADSIHHSNLRGFRSSPTALCTEPANGDHAALTSISRHQGSNMSRILSISLYNLALR
ncbi:hypothetical protein E2C01_018276 [Portunus trituberculatus]|uniref:Uncharacterized protein n=1 Tax=Portunus trituberculatus TaxID=210409 RepID=A0A5B7DVZ4_PORTR|nr:hypothetical protein [Portunus trituberculatus]